MIVLLLFTSLYIIFFKLVKDKGEQIFKQVQTEKDIYKPRIYLWLVSFILIITLCFALYNFEVKDSILSFLVYGIFWILNLSILFLIYKISDDSFLLKLFSKQIQIRKKTIAANVIESSIANSDHKVSVTIKKDVITENEFSKEDESLVNRVSIEQARWIVNKMFEFKFATTDEENIENLNKLINKNIGNNENSFYQIIDEVKNAGISIRPTKSMTQLTLVFSELIVRNFVTKLEVEYVFEAGVIITKYSKKTSKERIEEFRKHFSKFYGQPKNKLEIEKKQKTQQLARNKVDRSNEIYQLINEMIKL